MKKSPLDSFFKFTLGFLFFIGLSFGITYGVTYYVNQKDAASQSASALKALFDDRQERR